MTKTDFLGLLIKCSQDGSLPACNECRMGQYVNAQGLRCPAGLLLVSLDYYHPKLEGRAVTDPELDNRIVLPEGMTIRQLADIQEVHDTLAFRGWDHEVWVCHVATILMGDYENQST